MLTETSVTCYLVFVLKITEVIKQKREDEGMMGPSLRKSGQWFNPGGRNTEAPLFHMTLGAEDNQRKTVFCYVTSLPISPCHWDILNVYGQSLSREPCPLCSSPTGWKISWSERVRLRQERTVSPAQWPRPFWQHLVISWSLHHQSHTSQRWREDLWSRPSLSLS